MTQIDRERLQTNIEAMKKGIEKIDHAFNDYEFECEDMHIIDLRNALDKAITLAQSYLDGSLFATETKESIDTWVSVNLANAKYWSPEIKGSDFHGKMFMADFRQFLNQIPIERSCQHKVISSSTLSGKLNNLTCVDCGKDFMPNVKAKGKTAVEGKECPEDDTNMKHLCKDKTWRNYPAVLCSLCRGTGTLSSPEGKGGNK